MFFIGLLAIACVVCGLGVTVLNSNGRTIPFTPRPGKFGSINVVGLGNLNLAQWSPTQNTNMAPVTNFNSPQDNNGTPHAESVATIANTTFQCSGVLDDSASGYHPTVGDQGTATLGYSATSFFTVNFVVSSVGGPCTIDGVSALDFTITAIGLARISSANGGA